MTIILLQVLRGCDKQLIIPLICQFTDGCLNQLCVIYQHKDRARSSQHTMALTLVFVIRSCLIDLST